MLGYTQINMKFSTFVELLIKWDGGTRRRMRMRGAIFIDVNNLPYCGLYNRTFSNSILVPVETSL